MRAFLKITTVRVAIALMLLLMSVAGYGVYHHTRYKHFAVHEPGKVYRSAWLEPDALAELVRKYHIRAVVNLCRPVEMGVERRLAERQVVSDAGARLLELPMPLSVSPERDVDGITSHVEALANPENYPMLVHCKHGITRTAELLVIYDMLYRGMSADESLNAMPLFGRGDHDPHVWAFARQLESKRRNFSIVTLPDKQSRLR